MKKIGLIGGVGPESTIEYYKYIIKRYREILSVNDYPAILINSINLTKLLKLVSEKRFPDLINFLVEEIEVLKKSGAEVAAIASNTPHIVFNEIQKKVNIHLISIVEETCKLVHKKEIKRVCLFGTKSTMSAGFYQDTARDYQIEIITPDEKEQEYIHDKYMNELVNGILLKETKQKIIDIANDIKVKTNIKGLILGGTELPLIIKKNDIPGLEIFDSTIIHVESILDFALKDG